MNAVDVTAALARLTAEAPTEAREVTLSEGPAGAWALLYLPEGARWEAPGRPGGVTSALVLEGLATWATGGVRQTLTSGHLVVTASGEALTAHNDGRGPVSAVIGRSETPAASPLLEA